MTRADTHSGSPVEPIAIVGMACRFPRAPSVPDFWRLLEAGESGITEGVPGSGVGRIGELFPDAAVPNEACRFGAYLEDIDQFDAPFFRISPVEAQLLDPQQRIMLETSWRALEDAGIDPERLMGSRTGVYAGVSNQEYRELTQHISDTAGPAASLYAVSGTSFNTAIGRVAYALDLQGPTMALDTACSSSLVAVHQAVAGLQRGEADLALAGGVHVMLSGRLIELRANARMLAPDGRCKTFDASANGYVRGEGCGVLVLKRLHEAEADGDRIWGVIRGSAVNQDGASPYSLANFPARVTDIIGRSLPWTLGMVSIATVLSFCAGNLIGALMAWRRVPAAIRNILPVSLTFTSIPFFMFGILLISFLAFKWKIFPAFGNYGRGVEPGWNLDFILSVLHHGLLPVLSIVVTSMGFWALGMRGMMVTTDGEDYMILANAKGLRSRRIFWFYGIRNSMLPQVTALALNLGAVAGGSLLVELIFGYPGLGYFLYQAIISADYTVIQGIVFMLIVGVATAVLILDLLYPMIDPRITYSKGQA